MADHEFKKFGYVQISEICTQFNLHLFAYDYLESPTLATWRFDYNGRVEDILKYKRDFENRLGATILAADGLINIVAPKPNKDIVTLDSVLKSDFFNQCPGKLKVAVGECVDGAKYVANIEEWEQVLIAGTTGSGKTLFMHSIIHSIVHNCSPDEVKFVLIDFKGSEFSMYENISYLEKPIIYKTDRAVKILENMVEEMEKRFDFLRREGYQNIFDYNEEQEEKIHYIIIMIDEFTKLTLREKEAEELLIELSQRGRASGIFLILTVHKPTSDVLNTQIKAMFNTRIAFKLNSGSDSRTIIDENGAEDLFGNGDMYLMEGGNGKERIQTCFLSKEEIKEFGKKYRVDNLFTEEEEETPIDEKERNFYIAVKSCLELGIANKKTIYEAIRVGKREQEEILQRMIKEGIVSLNKSYYGRNDILITLDEFLDKYKEEDYGV